MANFVEQPAFYVGILLGLVLGWVTLWCFLDRWVGKIVVRILAVLCIGVGIQWIATPVADLLHGGSAAVMYVSPMGHGGFGAALGWGVGSLAIGVLAMVLTFIQFRSSPAIPSGEITDVRAIADGKR
ncbi:MAG TPA: hypothetical protein VFA18_08095 [Gemmataceae bacterium]|nr:hypothetical protein [Gemmataceae bacterium]